MEHVRADALPFDPRPQMGMIFADGFYQWLKVFSKDKERLAGAFAHIFDLSCFYLAMQDGEIAALAACTGGKPPPIRLDKKILRRTLGLLRGSLAFVMLNKHLVNHTYPFALSPQTGSIEFVATAPAHRGKGAAHALIEQMMHILPYDEYILEVADNNSSAIRLYEKLGFAAFKRTPAPKGSGMTHFVYMKRDRPPPHTQTP